MGMPMSFQKKLVIIRDEDRKKKDKERDEREKKRRAEREELERKRKQDDEDEGEENERNAGTDADQLKTQSRADRSWLMSFNERTPLQYGYLRGGPGCCNK